MITSRNMVLLEGNLVSDPNKPDNGPLMFSIAVNYAGRNSSNKDDTTGYFDVKFWLNENDYSAKANVASVAKAMSEGNLKKGTRVAIVGQLCQERWSTDGKTSSKTIVIAETVAVMFTGNKNSSGASESSASAPSPSSSFMDTF